MKAAPRPAAPTPSAPLPGDGGGERHLARRLTRLALGAAALALLVAGTLLNATAFLFERQALAQDATAQAQVIAANAAAALLFGDATAAQETLASLRAAPHISDARLITLRGETLARYRRDAAAPQAGPDDAVTATPIPGRAPAPVGTAEPADGWPPEQHFSLHLLSVVAPVQHQGVGAGLLRIDVPLAPLYAHAMLFGGITLAAAALALALSYGMTVGMRRDVHRIESQMLSMAYIDPVTGLYNRHAATGHLAEYTAAATAAAATQDTGYTVVTLDLDDFKTINDTLGHHVGDEVLREVARRLHSALQPGARAYRFGGDEFVIICPCADGYREPQRYGQMLRQALGGALRTAGVEIVLGGSVGVARYPLDGRTAADVLLASDIAMYQSKRNGKHQVTVFDARLRDASEQRLRIESELRQALRQGELRLVYQPIVDRAGRIQGAEALVRWQHPQRGLIGPADFIDVAESSGLVVALGGWVLTEAARQVVRWRQAGLPALQVAVNVSACQLRGGMLLSQYRDALADTGCDAARLEIELTEHSLVEDVDDNLRQLEALRALGAGIAIDDFGTGLSSLSYMKRLPVDKLKIDRSFIAGLPDDRGDRAIVAAALSMAHALGLQVVAEGVETAAQRDLLGQMGVDLLQGYYFGRPVAAEVLTTQLQRQMPVADTADRGIPA